MTTTNTMLNQEDAVRDATRNAWEGLMMRMGSSSEDGVTGNPAAAASDGSGPNNNNHDVPDAVRSKYTNRNLHDDCAVFVLLDGCTGKYLTGRPGSLSMQLPASLLSAQNSTATTTTTPASDTNEDYITIEYVKILPMGMQSAASVQVRVGTSHGGFCVLLKELEYTHDDDVKDGTSMEGNSNSSCWVWKCISIALAPEVEYDEKNAINKVLPDSFSQVTSLVWDGYCHANRCCDGTLMARYFHPTCRLTYKGGPNDNHRIVIIESDSFYGMVQDRYSTKHPIHVPYAQWKDDPSVGESDTLHSIEFVTPYLAMVILRVGHPPYLWTDLLTCARIGDNDRMDHHVNLVDGVTTTTVDSPQAMDRQPPKWWIIHKSSESEPHPLSLTDTDGTVLRI
jgi:hypothetical protein